MQDHTNDPVWKQAIAGSQMLLVAFGALVLMPLITGLDPNVALFTAGLGTLLFLCLRVLFLRLYFCDIHTRIG